MKKVQESKVKKSTIKSTAHEQNNSLQKVTKNSSTTPPTMKQQAHRLESPSRSRPKPISSREDPLERVQAFLTEMPVLD